MGAFMVRLLAGVVAGAVTVSALATESIAINVRNADAARTWQVNLSPGEPIGWPWGDADAATLVVSNAIEKTVATYQVPRNGEELFGSCEIILPTDVVTCEHVLFLSLTLFDGEVEIVRKDARVAYLPGTFAVDQPGGKDWRTLTRPRTFAYDPDWAEAEAAAAALTLAAGGQSVSVPLAGTAGYDVIDPAGLLGDGFSGPFRASLAFDGAEAFAADLRFGVPGMLLLFR